MLVLAPVLLYWSLAISVAFAAPAKKSWLENLICNKKHPDITLLGQEVPIFKKPAQRQVRYLLPFRKGVADPKSAEWQLKFFGTATNQPALPYQPRIDPIRPDAPTIISLFYPDPNPDPNQPSGRTIAAYMERIRNLAATQEQVIFYASRSIAPQIRALRKDKHWLVIDEYPEIWDVPTNKHLKRDFYEKHKALFWKMNRKGPFPNQVYNDPFKMGVYNAKAYFMHDAALRNPFRSTRWVYMDGGLLRSNTAPISLTNPKARPWGMLMGPQGFLDNKKLDRIISLTRDTGVAFPEYPLEFLPNGDPTDINAPAFNEPAWLWQDKFYLGGVIVGNTLGILNYGVRYMQTVELMNDNGLYIGREEFIIPMTTILYPNTIFSQPVQQIPRPIGDMLKGMASLKNWTYMLLSFSTWGSPYLPQIRDPISQRYCGTHTQYRPREWLPAMSWNVVQ